MQSARVAVCSSLVPRARSRASSAIWERRGGSALLLTVDVICHGVPAPRLWSEWIDYKNVLRDSNVCDVNMRSKTTGWLSFSSCESTIFNQD